MGIHTFLQVAFPWAGTIVVGFHGDFKTHRFNMPVLCAEMALFRELRKTRIWLSRSGAARLGHRCPRLDRFNCFNCWSLQLFQNILLSGRSWLSGTKWRPTELVMNCLRWTSGVGVTLSVCIWTVSIGSRCGRVLAGSFVVV